jgi:hypothetical protein
MYLEKQGDKIKYMKYKIINDDPLYLVIAVLLMFAAGLILASIMSY